jgi:hypothetical protein
MWYILGVGVLGVGALLVGILAGRFVKKRLRSDRPTEGFTIRDLREMRERDDITQREYEAMRALIIGQLDATPRSDAREGPAEPHRESQRPGFTSDPPSPGSG